MKTDICVPDAIERREENLPEDPLIQPLLDINELEEKIPVDGANENLASKSSTTITTTTTAKKEKPLTSIFRRSQGILYAFIASAVFTLSTFLIKQIQADLFDTLLSRFLLQSILLTIFIQYKKYKIFDGSSQLIAIEIVRALFGALGLLCLYGSYMYIPLPDLTTVRYSQVIWTAILSMIIFRERISKFTVIAIVMTLIGVVCVAQPTFLFRQRSTSFNETSKTTSSNDSKRFLGFSLALACALSISLSIVLNKKVLVCKIPHSVIIYHFALFNLVLLIAIHLYSRFILRTYDKRSMFSWAYALASTVSLLQLFSSTIIQKAFKLEHPSIVSIVQSSDILFATLLQNLFTSEKSNGLVLLGAAFVTTSIILVGVQKLWKEEEQTSTTPTKV